MQGSFLLADVLGKALMSAQGVEVTVSPVSGIPVAIVAGMLLNNTLSLPASLRPGTKFCTATVLRAGIICVGANLSAVDVVTLGAMGVPAVVACVTTGLGVATVLGRTLGLPDRMTSLIAAGTSICGVTAITALAPAIKASEREVAVAVAYVVAFGTLGMLTCVPACIVRARVCRSCEHACGHVLAAAEASTLAAHVGAHVAVHVAAHVVAHLAVALGFVFLASSSTSGYLQPRGCGVLLLFSS